MFDLLIARKLLYLHVELMFAFKKNTKLSPCEILAFNLGRETATVNFIHILLVRIGGSSLEWSLGNHVFWLPCLSIEGGKKENGYGDIFG